MTRFEDVLFCCEFGNGTCDAPAVDWPEHRCLHVFWESHGAHAVPLHFPGVGDKPGIGPVASEPVAVGDGPCFEASPVSVSNTPGRVGSSGEYVVRTS
jgi:hypothetical protein